jgi:ribonuclease HI
VSKTDPANFSQQGIVHYELVFDGGSRGNPGPSYGSYRLRKGKYKARKPVRLIFEEGTNNEAEYQTLVRALGDLLVELEREGIDPQSVHLTVMGDSKLVIHQVRGEWKAKNQRMRALRDEVMNLAKRFAAVEYEHQVRWRSVAALGH